ncbi:MAG: MerR family transcriptional regulator [Rhodobacteraceae bacterium]|nr:MerR family transcriptional regulator [Paracoccaceae bacterium]
MDKSPDAFRTISEVADWLGIQAHVLRFWESKFTQVKPVKRAGGRRYYRPADMLLLGGIKKLLHEDGMTIKGVQKVLREQGVGAVSGLSQALDDVAVSADRPRRAHTVVPLHQRSSLLDERDAGHDEDDHQIEMSLGADGMARMVDDHASDDDPLIEPAGFEPAAVDEPGPEAPAPEGAVPDTPALDSPAPDSPATPPVAAEAPEVEEVSAEAPEQDPEPDPLPIPTFRRHRGPAPSAPSPADSPAETPAPVAAEAAPDAHPEPLTESAASDPAEDTPDDAVAEAPEPIEDPVDVEAPVELADTEDSPEEPEAAAPRPRIVDAPDPPADDAVEAAPGILSQLASLNRLSPEQRAEIAALAEALDAWRSGQASRHAAQ